MSDCAETATPEEAAAADAIAHIAASVAAVMQILISRNIATEDELLDLTETMKAEISVHANIKAIAEEVAGDSR